MKAIVTDESGYTVRHQSQVEAVVLPDNTTLLLIDALSHGEIVSGELLGTRLSISRAAVWKQLQKLDQLGLTVERVRGVGYRVPGGIDLLCGSDINHRLQQHPAVCSQPAVRLHTVVDSTNRVAMRELETEGVWGVFHAAECQTAGKGRRGRSWVSPYAAAVYLSVGWQFDEGVAAVMGLSLAAGVAVRRAIKQVTGHDVQLKWPNDLIANGKKLGGILIELVGDPSDRCRVVLGVGVNVRTPARFDEEISQPWVNLEEVAGRPVSRNELVAAMVRELQALFTGYGPGAFADIREEWLRADSFSGATVTLSTPSQAISGIARGVDESGAILLEQHDGQIVACHGGELSLRGVSM